MNPLVQPWLTNTGLTCALLLQVLWDLHQTLPPQSGHQSDPNRTLPKATETPNISSLKPSLENVSKAPRDRCPFPIPIPVGQNPAPLTSR